MQLLGSAGKFCCERSSTVTHLSQAKKGKCMSGAWKLGMKRFRNIIFLIQHTKIIYYQQFLKGYFNKWAAIVRNTSNMSFN